MGWTSQLLTRFSGLWTKCSESNMTGPVILTQRAPWAVVFNIGWTNALVKFGCPAARTRGVNSAVIDSGSRWRNLAVNVALLAFTGSLNLLVVVFVTRTR